MGFLCDFNNDPGAKSILFLAKNMELLIRKLVVLIFGLFFAFMALLRLAVQFIFNPRLFRKVKRSAPPCLTDNKYGYHHYVKTASNIKFHYVSKGNEEKPLMLFVHGFPEFWYSWRYQLAGLDLDEYRLVALDLRGYGDSDKPEGVANYKTNILVKDVKEFIEALGYSSCVMVAHDWGGVIAWRFAHEYSTFLEKLVILNAPHMKVYQEVVAKHSSQKMKSWYMAFFQVPYVPELTITANDMKVFDEGFWKKPMGLNRPENFTEEDMEAFKYTFGKPGAFTPPINYYRNIISKYKPLGSYVAKIPCPVLVIWGTADAALDELLLEGLDKYVDDLTIRRIVGASHWVQQDEPVLVNNYIKEFLSK